mmetsp:Transcript_38926/g.125829  ORF Transcript_38926/g.125829 Transcript_38926/m.125829 type:complete len:222 (-) Transcript_38926:84-749(-)
MTFHFLLLALPAVPQPLTSVDVEKYVGRWYQVRAESHHRSCPTRPLHRCAPARKPADPCQRHGQVHVRAGRQLRHRRLRGHFCARRCLGPQHCAAVPAPGVLVPTHIHGHQDQRLRCAEPRHRRGAQRRARTARGRCRGPALLRSGQLLDRQARRCCRRQVRLRHRLGGIHEPALRPGEGCGALSGQRRDRGAGLARGARLHVAPQQAAPDQPGRLQLRGL